jgi:hypothetical protein
MRDTAIIAGFIRLPPSLKGSLMFSIVNEDLLVKVIFQTVEENQAAPQDKLNAIVRAGKIAEIYLGSFTSSEAFRITRQQTLLPLRQ